MTGRFAGTRAVVIGAGVAGSSAALALLAGGRRGAWSPSADARSRIRVSSEAAGAAVRSGGHARRAPGGRGPRRDEPGRAAERGGSCLGARHGHPRLGRARARRPARLAPVPRRHGHERQDDRRPGCSRRASARPAATRSRAATSASVPDGGPRADTTVLVVEASSFQLATQTSFHPRVSVLLNLAPDHLDWHGSFDAYVDAKAKVHALQTPRRRPRRQPRRPGRGARVRVGARAGPCGSGWASRRAGEVGYVGDALVSTARRRRRDRGRSTPSAPATARTPPRPRRPPPSRSACPATPWRPGSPPTSPARHRGETVASVDGVRFIDNSKATNVHAALAAIDGVREARADRRRPREGSGPLAARRRVPTACRRSSRSARARTRSSRVFEGRVPDDGRGLDRGGDADRVRAGAPARAWSCSRRRARAGIMFRDYEERGDRFAAAARALGTRAG